MAAVAAQPYLDPSDLAGQPGQYDPNAIAAGAPPPGAPVAAVPAPPTVLTPLGQLPAATIPQDPQAAQVDQPVTGPADVAAAPPPAGAAAPAAPAAPPGPEALPPIPPVPQPPEPTGDPAKDTQANIAYSRALAQHGEILAAHQEQINSRKAVAQGAEADQEVAAARAAEAQRQKLQAEATERRAKNQAAIDQAIADRAAAQKDLETKDPMGGGKIVALIAGALGQARQNMGMVQRGMAPTAQNTAMQVIDQMSQQEYERKKNRLANASEALLQARYGYKDSEDNHRAALNDLDADLASHYALIRKEAESQLRRVGAGQAEIDQNQIVLAARQKQAEYENGIHEREEKQETERQHYAAEEALSGTHLDLEKQQIQATIAGRRDALDEKKIAREEREARLADAAAAKKDAAKDKADKTVINDPDTGKPLATVASTRVVDKVASDVAAVKHYDQITHEYADHIDKYGTLTNPLSKEYKDRASLAAQVKAAGAALPNSGIQGNEKGAAMEEAVVGSPGLLFGDGHGRLADTTMLRKLAEERTDAASQRLRMEMQPLPGEKQAKLPEFIHTAPKGSTGDRARAVLADPAKRAALSDAQLAIVMDAAKGK